MAAVLATDWKIMSDGQNVRNKKFAPSILHSKSVHVRKINYTTTGMTVCKRAIQTMSEIKNYAKDLVATEGFVIYKLTKGAVGLSAPPSEPCWQSLSLWEEMHSFRCLENRTVALLAV